MTHSLRPRNPHRVTAASTARTDQSRHPGFDSRPRRRVTAVLAVLVLALLAVVLLEAAGFDRRVAAASIAVLATDVFASWFVIAQASHGSSRRITRARANR